MCGIAGYAGFTQSNLIERMCAALVHRGPDSKGSVEFPAQQMALGIRRLAVIDLATGDQPARTDNGRVQLVFNGEIYNYRELRAELQALGHRFNTASDTEVVLNAYIEWGGDAWARLHGMFAIAIADLRQEAAVLKVVRDRVGIKPLYYIFDRKRILFASEMKALLAWQGFGSAINLDAIASYLALRYVPGPGSLFEFVRKLPPGHELTFSAGEMSLRPWWTPPGPERQDKYLSDDDAVLDMGEALRTAVRRHMISDVPVGAFWSGGIDFSVIVALMAELSSGPVRTFSVRFPGHPDDDVRRAAGMASALGTRHTEIECQAQDFAALPDIVWSLDEPIGDPIVVPTSVLAREARKAVTVVLSGEGADELFGGYLFHRKLVALDQWRTRLPGAVWPFAAWLVERLPRALLDRAFDYPGRLGHEGRRKLAHLFRAAGEDGLSELYKTSISLFDADDIAQATSGRLPLAAADLTAPMQGTSLQRLLALQYADWLPDLILMRSDKIAMAHSLECRVPFLDDLVINTAARGPDAAKLRGKLNKWVLRRFSKSLLPDAFANAPKQAFYAPLDPYLRRGPLREIMDAALDPARLKRRGLFDPGYVTRLAATPRESFLVEKRLFSILMLELWFERFAPDASWA